jgi:hypothetical protein
LHHDWRCRTASWWGDTPLSLFVTELTTAYQAADTTLTTTLTGVDTRLQTVEADPAFDLSTYVQVVEEAINGLAGPHVIFTGVNVHIRSGACNFARIVAAIFALYVA